MICDASGVRSGAAGRAPSVGHEAPRARLVPGLPGALALGLGGPRGAPERPPPQHDGPGALLGRRPVRLFGGSARRWDGLLLALCAPRGEVLPQLHGAVGDGRGPRPPPVRHGQRSQRTAAFHGGRRQRANRPGRPRDRLLPDVFQQLPQPLRQHAIVPQLRRLLRAGPAKTAARHRRQRQEPQRHAEHHRGVGPPRGERRVPHVPPLQCGAPAPRRRRLLADVQAAPRRLLLGLPRRPDRAGRIRAAALPQELVRATRERPRRAARLLTLGQTSAPKVNRDLFLSGFPLVGGSGGSFLVQKWCNNL